MNRSILALAALLLLAPPAFSCSLTAPEVVSWACDDYRTTDQWSCFNVVVESNNPLPAPENGKAEPLPFAKYFSLWKDGTLVPVTVGPTLSGANVNWTFSQGSTSDGCYKASYTGQGIADSPDKPSFCVEDPKFPNDCKTRVDASFPAESAGWQWTDTAGHTGPVVVSKPCIKQGPPFNVADRGSLCMEP